MSILLAVMLGLSGAVADEPNASQDLQFCLLIATAAENVMVQRQTKDDMAESIRVVAEMTKVETPTNNMMRDVYTTLTQDAYKLPREATPDARKAAVSEFKNRALDSCLRNVRSN